MTSLFCTRRFLFTVLAIVTLATIPGSAQVTTGTISGRITDSQGGALPGVVVSARQPETGFAREVLTNETGTYQLLALPNGVYRVSYTMSGFRTVEVRFTVNVSSNLVHDVKLQLAGPDVVVDVQGTAAVVSGMRSNVELERLEGLPINGRQIADFLGTQPGVSVGTHSDPSRATLRTAQIGGANGRNLAVTYDGGDNNDDVIGGQQQPIPLEAIQELNLHTFRFDAEHGRGSSLVNIVTKSGTNELRGSWFTTMRDEALNARTVTETNLNVPKGDYDRYQYGGSLGGPILLNKAHFFAAYERTRQDTRQGINTGGALPGDGVYAVPFREHLFTGKVTVAPNRTQYLSVRYARDYNTSPSGVAPNAAYSTWVTSTNTFDSLNVNHNWQTGPSSVNEFLFQYSHYKNDTPGNGVQTLPAFTLANGAKGGANASAPQTTEQRRFQFRNDYSMTVRSRHQMRAGINIVHTPTLAVTNDGGTTGMMQLLGNDPQTSGVSSILLIGGHVSSNTPLDLYGLFLQDDWRVSDRLTLNLGVRWDYLDGVIIDQPSWEFAAMQAAGQTGRFAGTHLSDFGKTPRGDYDNIQPRFGAVYDLSGNGRNVFRAGWGIYTEVAYTNSNILTSSLTGGGIILDRRAPTGFRYGPDNTLFTINDSIDVLGLPYSTPSVGEVVSPRLEQPYTRQANVGWTHELTRTTSLSADYVRADGRDLNMRLRTNVLVNGTRYLSDLGITAASFRTAVSKGESQYDALILSGRKRMSNRVDVDASYTLAKATSHIGTASDELAQNLLQDVQDPFSDFQKGPSTRTDARHRVTASAIVDAPLGIKVASIFSFRSALPITTLVGQDVNGDGAGVDHTPIAYRYTGLNGAGLATFEEAGPCETVNCSRRAPFSQLNLRVSRSFPLIGRARIEAMADVFNLFNAKNPALPLSTTRLVQVSATEWAQSTGFMQPTAYAGDVGQGEQRLAQFGVRLTF